MIRLYKNLLKQLRKLWEMESLKCSKIGRILIAITVIIRVIMIIAPMIMITHHMIQGGTMAGISNVGYIEFIEILDELKIGYQEGVYENDPFFIFYSTEDVEIIDTTLKERGGDLNDINWGFDDEYSICACCDEAVIKISPDCWGWTRPTILLDSRNTDQGYICSACAEKLRDDVLEEYKNKEKHLPISIGDLCKVNDEVLMYSRFYPTLDKPKGGPEIIIKALTDKDIDHWFKVYPEQFGSTYDLYVRPGDLTEAKEVLNENNI